MVGQVAALRNHAQALLIEAKDCVHRMKLAKYSRGMRQARKSR